MMKKVTAIFLVFVMSLVFTACSMSETDMEKTFEVGQDVVEMEAVGASEYDPTFTVNLRVVGGNGEDLYNGTVALKSPTMWVNEFLKAAITDKGLAQSGIETGFIDTIGDYVNNSADNYYWMYRVNGEMPAFGSNRLQARNGDYIEFVYEQSTME